MNHETLERVEKQRLDLENNISKLKKSLRHWQTLELDYDVLKDEFLPLPENASKDACLEAAKESGAELIDEKEVQDLISDSKVGHKRPSQIVELLTKRLEYVARSISTLRNQLSDAEKKRNALLLAEDPDLRDEAGLPLAEITEELDEQGNVVSSKVQNPGKDTSNLAKVLQKAGVKGFTDENIASKHDGNEMNANDAVATSLPNAALLHQDSEEGKTVHHLESVNTLSSKKDSEADAKKTLLPTNAEDSEEEAKLRQEMLEYGLDEVMPIVAELEMDDDGDELSDEDDDFDEGESGDESEDDEEDESEDESGRTRRPRISDRYRKKMEELEESLGLKDMKNLGPSPEFPLEVKQQLDRPSPAEAARKAAIAREEATRNNVRNDETSDGKKTKKASKKKKVAFASNLDIANDAGKSSQPVPISLENLPERPRVKPIGEDIVERTNEPELKGSSARASTKTSKFKAARSANPQTPLFPPPMDFPPTSTAVPEGPPGKTIADTLIERDATKGEPSVSAPDSDDFDDEMHKREVAAEFYKLRNRKIHEQGGYVGDGEQDNYGDDVAASFVEDESTGKRRKVSRFKAARMEQ